jgi:sporulation protein YlmC with PRC-barrel domain
VPSKLSRVVKRQVVTVAEGRRLGRPEGVALDPERHRVAYLVLARGALPDTSLVVAAEKVSSFDTDALAIDSLDSLLIAARDEEALRLLRRDEDFRRHPVLTSRGMKLGRVSGVVVDERGEVISYRVRKGIRGWLMPAQKVKPDELGTFGGEVAVVSGGTTDEPATTKHDTPAGT